MPSAPDALLAALAAAGLALPLANRAKLVQMLNAQP
jgi:hypothetical protein